MRVVIAAVGRLKQGPERDLAASYRKRAEATGRSLGFRDVEIIEIRESRAQDTERRRIEEAIAIATIIPDGAVVVCLDERGENLDSAALAGLLREWRGEDRGAVCFVVGGADGLAPSLARACPIAVRFRQGDLAASIGADHVARTDLPGRDHSDRPSVPSRVKHGVSAFLAPRAGLARASRSSGSVSA